MIRVSILATACLAVAACGASKADKTAATCTAMLGGDPEIQEDLAEDGDTLEAYCGCYSQLLADEPEANQETILKVSRVIADIREENNLGLEEAAGRVDDDFDASGNSSAYGVTATEFETTGRYVDTVRRALTREDGACHSAG
ncbi:hypothetical protein [Hyphomonas pacifica]|uniref:Uncharacterized protein n=1 Tax=Hyphomonas pacifica TaxID=1280941 RepID=A0A062TVV5_9PROT|nr:hypothetical protein [Hyphomonas pacifica]KCZ52136.1 hypothetical protein HY2_09855 [Hyphomonas pacifica]RAN32260.1 hypothetical protein HY3_02740 [Hyphomonas pacifica]RAN33852.1 hypothetical protein HY11_03930 [Hyphomonas pacifica]